MEIVSHITFLSIIEMMRDKKKVSNEFTYDETDDICLKRIVLSQKNYNL